MKKGVVESVKVIPSIIILIGLCIAAFFNTFTPSKSEIGIVEVKKDRETISDNIWRPSLEDYSPSTPGWRAINERRFKQLATSDCTTEDRFSFYSLAIHSALTSKNFTEYGWALTKAPQAVTDKLKKRLHDGLQKRDQQSGPVETKEKTTFFIPDDAHNEEIVQQLLPLHEAWSGVKLVPQNSYGLRVYRGATSLNMHIDRPDTHVISSILHVDHGEHDEPWPIVIEDFSGKTNEVFLESGDMLFYESSKCMHGRPRIYNGDYYSSLFTHYYPVEGWDEVYERAHALVPPSYTKRQEKEVEDINEEDAITDGTSVVEPACEHGWCGLRETVKWHGPGPSYGKILTGNGKVTELKGVPSERAFNKLSPMAAKTQEVIIQGGDDF